jgi:hypothetical protein
MEIESAWNALVQFNTLTKIAMEPAMKDGGQQIWAAVFLFVPIAVVLLFMITAVACLFAQTATTGYRAGGPISSSTDPQGAITNSQLTSTHCFVSCSRRAMRQ